MLHELKAVYRAGNSNSEKKMFVHVERVDESNVYVQFKSNFDSPFFEFQKSLCVCVCLFVWRFLFDVKIVFFCRFHNFPSVDIQIFVNSINLWQIKIKALHAWHSHVAEFRGEKKPRRAQTMLEITEHASNYNHFHFLAKIVYNVFWLWALVSFILLCWWQLKCNL